MPDEEIQQNFKYKLGKNTDFQALATLFEKNSKTDPKLLKKMLDPEVVNDLFMKGNTNPKMLLKYVQKGANFDPDLVRKIHKNNNDIFRQNSNNPLDDILQRERDKKDNMDSLSQKYNNVMGNTFNRNKMSRTDIGNGGFFAQLVPIRNKNKIGGNNMMNQMSDTHFEQSQEGSAREEQQYTEGEEIVEFIEDDDDGKRPRRKLKKKKKNQFSDIRLKAEEIYLQRLEAPHETKMRKNSIRKKKQKSTTTMKFEAMDSDNDVYDMNF